jgi:c-di-GMP-related signal transduction protein
VEKFLARQPIFNTERVVYGYELLFRSGPDNYFVHPAPDMASVSAADNLFLIGIDRLARGRRAFINCTRSFLLRDYASLLPKDRVVLEILESIIPDEEVVAACQRLKAEGYLIALDDFCETPEWRPLVLIADFIKVDVLATAPAEQLRLAKKFARTPVKLIAEKVETHEDFERTLGWGYSYFQGYFFQRPEILSHHDIPASKLNYLRILKAANEPILDLEKIAEQIQSEASLSYRLLRYLNSPLFFLRAEIHSIQHALSLIGERGVRKWVSLVAVACMGDGKPEELIILPLIRARFCELMAPSARLESVSNDLFLLGLLSAMDALLDMKMEAVLREIAVEPEIRDALLGRKNRLREVFDIALHYEAGSWEAIDEAAGRMGIGAETIPGCFLQAVEWARKLMSGDAGTGTEAESS